ncbi:hypothetical protein XCR1_800012 [Xenorhabdus cabanillasii JM26]|uniref:Uncharacterized protein n=1 Tax=Xenorhabdus cabanillasii JM26 TaxID=1427517 RepID=W1J858_9GAMM|nr:hypothetical protein XCR1_800012 [Xenorhabdus cabanillasii JM26]
MTKALACTGDEKRKHKEMTDKPVLVAVTDLNVLFILCFLRNGT